MRIINYTYTRYYIHQAQIGITHLAFPWSLVLWIRNLWWFPYSILIIIPRVRLIEIKRIKNPKLLIPIMERRLIISKEDLLQNKLSYKLLKYPPINKTVRQPHQDLRAVNMSFTVCRNNTFFTFGSGISFGIESYPYHMKQKKLYNVCQIKKIMLGCWANLWFNIIWIINVFPFIPVFGLQK